MFALLCAVALPLGACGPEADDASPGGATDADRPHLIVVMLDTLRADHLPLHGYARDTSPTLSGLAAESVLFERQLATSSSTAPSQMSILTGTLPRAHGVYNDVPAAPAEDFPFLPSLLRDAGWRTAAFADGGIVTSAYGFDAGFEHFDSKYEGFGAKLDRFEAWLADAPDEPTFLYVHTYGVHAPYLPEPGHDLFTDPAYDGPLKRSLGLLAKERASGRERPLDGVLRSFWKLVDPKVLNEADLEYLRGMYDGCIHGVDAGVQRLLTALEDKGWLDDAWLVVTSDHGEAFGEHGTMSHRQLHQEELHVPLLIRPPGGGAPQRVARGTTHLDLAPTLLGLLDQPVPEAMQGVSLLPFDGAPAPSAAFATDSERQSDAVVFEDFKLVERRNGSVRLFALGEDPTEQLDLSAEQADRVARWRDLLDDMRRRTGRLQSELGTPRVDLEGLDEAQLAELRALGYIK